MALSLVLFQHERRKEEDEHRKKEEITDNAHATEGIDPHTRKNMFRLLLVSTAIFSVSLTAFLFIMYLRHNTPQHQTQPLPVPYSQHSQLTPIPTPTNSSSPLQPALFGNTFVSDHHDTPGSEQDLVDNIGNIIFFAYNDATLSDDAKTTLFLQAQWLAKYPSVNVLVAGNADGTGSEEDALGLAQRRALAAQAYLVSQGVAPSRIDTISFGNDCPIVAGKDANSAEQNRNVITSIQGDNPQGCEGVLPDPSSISSLVTLPPGTVVPAP